MSQYNDVIRQAASELSLDDTKVINKAAELARLLQTKTTSLNHMSDMSKIVICLDLAARLLNVGFDTKLAQRLSCLRPPVYLNYKNSIERTLNITKEKINVSALCLGLNCASVQPLVETVLNEYQKSKQIADITIPQYICMAVYHACKLSKVKISKSKLLEKSLLKPSQWSNLDAEWSKFIDEHFADYKKKKDKSKKSSKMNVDDVDQDPVENEQEMADQMEEENAEPYEDWKKKILEVAYKELKLKDLAESKKKDCRSPRKSSLRESNNTEVSMKTECMGSPRKSPRKTPQKLTPFKSMNKGEGVKLVFKL